MIKLFALVRPLLNEVLPFVDKPLIMLFAVAGSVPFVKSVVAVSSNDITEIVEPTSKDILSINLFETSFKFVSLEFDDILPDMSNTNMRFTLFSIFTPIVSLSILSAFVSTSKIFHLAFTTSSSLIVFKSYTLLPSRFSQ